MLIVNPVFDQAMAEKPTVVIIGSGFGGSVFACRLAESGRYSVHVLERGRRYNRNEFPRRTDQLEQAFWEPRRGLFGMFEYQSFPKTDIDVLTASGLGGGSLIYANVLYEMPPEFFEGWPGGIRRPTLDPYYDRVHRMMESRAYPVDEPGWPYAATPKTRALQLAGQRLAADSLGHPAAELEWPRLAIQFGPHPGDELVNAQGVKQTACVMCGECDIGCNYHAKNTLDLNYLARATNYGASIHTHAEVRAIRPAADGGYRVVYCDPRDRSRSEEIEARYVVVSAGSLGSTKLLLRMRHAGELPRLSGSLGTQWCGNGDLLGFSFRSEEPIYPSTGPVITGAIRFYHARYPDGFPHGLFVEDAGIPNLMAWYLAGMAPSPGAVVQSLKGAAEYAKGFVAKREVNLGDELGPLLFHESRLVSRTMIFLGMGRDRSTGVFRLEPNGSGPLGWDQDGEIQLDWDVAPSRLHFDRTRDAMQRMTDALGGEFAENPLSFLTKYVAVHPLGGCPMGDSERNGVVDARTGEVFGHPGLYVADGSVLPTAVGPNPSLTIAALAEMFTERFPGS